MGEQLHKLAMGYLAQRAAQHFVRLIITRSCAGNLQSADDRATARMILTFETSGGTIGPLISIPGDRQRPMNALCYSFTTDDCGRFT